MLGLGMKHATEDIIGDLMELIGILWYLVRYSEINEIQ